MDGLIVMPEEATTAHEQDPLVNSPGSFADAERLTAYDHRLFLAASLRRDVLAHLQAVGLLDAEQAVQETGLSKQGIRDHHALQRSDRLRREWRMAGRRWGKLLAHFADGSEVRPEVIAPVLEMVESGRESGELFRLATLLWSVPVSRGFGRRMRFLVRDQSNGKLIGLFALGDPVFNLRARDSWIGWDVNARRERLVNVMDAYVLGAVQPYARLLGGKLIASMIGSAEVADAFASRYGDSTGIISGRRKGAQLALVTVTSALGRSSLYNRVKLRVPSANASGDEHVLELQRIGMTRGYGHFQLSDDLFERLRRFLLLDNHAYVNGHQFGQGPNWRMRVARVALKAIGLDDELLRHGIAREVYAMPLAANARQYLRGETSELRLERPPAAVIAAAALRRWVLPRACRCSDYQLVKREQIFPFLADARPEQLYLPALSD